MKEIPLTQGKVALVDDGDYEWLSRWKWFAHLSRGKWYVGRNSKYIRGQKRHGVKMHREVMGLKRGDKEEVDHIDGDPLNNQRSNLRICDRHGNCQNSRKRKDAVASRYKGVTRWKGRGLKPWSSRIFFDGGQYTIGYYLTEAEAALAYNEVAKEQFGEFAHLNEVTE